MTTWFYAFALKLAILPVFAFMYWLLAIKGGEWLAKLIPSPKWREILTRERYDFSSQPSRPAQYPAHRRQPEEFPE